MRKAIAAGFFYQTARLTKTGNYVTAKTPQTVHIHPSSALAEARAKALLADGQADKLTDGQTDNTNVAKSACLRFHSRMPTCLPACLSLCLSVRLSVRPPGCLRWADQ
jgi:Oligonucleotide/oligosaccharide-binding (OB)-fold